MRELFLFCLISFFTLSCETNNPDTPASEVPDDAVYFPLAVGNSWVYQNVDIDSLGQETIRLETDSMIISRDTLLNDLLYYVLEGTNYPFNGGEWGVIDILRDSMGYLVNLQGEVKLSNTNFSDTLYVRREQHQDELLFTLSYKMESEDTPCTVPAGTFQVINYKGTLVGEEDREGIPNPRYLNTRYAEGVGNVLKTYFFFSSSTISEKRLVSYKIAGPAGID